MSTAITAVYSWRVRYLRLLTNSVAAAILATCYVLILLLQLNPRLPLDPLRLVPIAQSVGAFYVVHLMAVFYTLLVARQLLAREPLSPAWISVGVLSWLGAIAAGAGSALMWANVQTFGLVLPPDIVSDMMRGALALAVSALLFVLVALGRRNSDGQQRLLWASCFVVVAAVSLATPVFFRGPGVDQPLEARPLDAVLDVPPPERAAKVSVIAIDGGSLDLIARATAQGRLPNFGRIIDSGAAMRLATLHPTSAEAVWTAVATGKLPQKNGVRSAAVYRTGDDLDPIRLLPDFCYASGLMRFGVLAEEPLTSAALRARPLWSILSLLGIRVGVLNWPLTYPAPVVRGYLVSDQYSRPLSGLSGAADPGVVYPPELFENAAALGHEAWNDMPAIVPVGTTIAVPERHQQPGRADRLYDTLGQRLSRAESPQVTIVRYESIDPIGHYFLRYAVPQEFGDVSEDDRRRYGQVLESHYGFIDDVIGRALAALGPDDLLLVVSGYGMEPLGFGKRMLERVLGDPEVSGSHEGAPDGFLLAYGAAVANARQLRRASIVDVVPTVLYFLGLPIGRDMDGYARTDIFRPSFTDDRPMTFIPTYER
jgi:predicted AlkP superfamily phosphohydrolase/phosphomutase